MSAQGMTAIVLATQLAEACRKDEAPEGEGHDISAGICGPHVSQWLRDVAAELVATQAQASLETFEAFWAKLPIPGEYDAMDPIDQRRWRDVVRQAFDHAADASKMVAADLSDADGWIACADRLPDLDVPVFGTAGMGISVYMRDHGCYEGWLWARQTWVHDLASLQGFECDDDYEVTHWRPLFALPEGAP